MAESATSSSQSPAPELIWQARHNICAFLDEDALFETDKAIFGPICAFFRRSRVARAISENTIVYKSQVSDFWHSAYIETVDGNKVIKAKVAGNSISVTEGEIRRVLGIKDDPTDRIDPEEEKVRAILLRCGYTRVDKMVYKREFCPHFKYIAHIIIHCLGSRKGGYDTLNKTQQNTMAALISNMPYNFSRMIFSEMMKNTTDQRNKFLMFPRFVQLLINSHNFDISSSSSDALGLENMNVDSILAMKAYTGPRPKNKPLFGHLIKEDYVCPEGLNWKHEDSETEDNIQLTQPAEPTKSAKKRKDKGKEVEDLGFEKPSRRRKLNLVIRESAPKPSQPQPQTQAAPTVESPAATDMTLDAKFASLLSKIEEDRKRQEAELAERISAEMETRIRSAVDQATTELRAENERLKKELEEERTRLLAVEKKIDPMKMNDEGFYINTAYVTLGDEDESSSDDDGTESD